MNVKKEIDSFRKKRRIRNISTKEIQQLAYVDMRNENVSNNFLLLQNLILSQKELCEMEYIPLDEIDFDTLKIKEL